jgi:hypothetical protein
MKKTLLPLIVIFLLSGCFTTKDYVVESDYSYKGNFKKYKTYMFIETPSSDPDFDPELDQKLKRMIKNRMGAQGYQFNSKKPDLLVNYKFYMQDLEFLGVQQPRLEYWLRQARYDENGERIYYNEDEEGYLFENLELQEGALLITFFDRKKKFSVWHGYSSGWFDKERDNNDRYLRAAVNQIFDEYRLIAEGYEIKSN